MSDKWVYLTDLAPQATVKNLATGEVRSIMSNAVVGRAPSGLRRTVLEIMPGGMFRETDEVLSITDDLAEEIEEYYAAPNSWNYDWPHLPTEQGDSPDAQQQLRDLIMAQMGDVPFDFKITAMQRRFLMYFSDGNMESQKRFDRFIPQPSTSPFNRKWDLRSRYDMYYNSIMRDAKVPFPKDKQHKWGAGRPCLYVGPAWTLRFQIDDQDPLLERCRVYVMDDGTFIGSDWCQRHDFSSYNGGINLQMGIYTLASWVMGPCLTYNSQHGGVTLKSTEYKVEKVRDLMKRSPHVLVPSFDDSFNKAQSLIKQYAPKVAEPVTPKADAGPITKDAIAAADAAFQQALGEILAKRANVDTTVSARAEAGNEPAAVAVPLGVLSALPDYLGSGQGWDVFNVDCSSTNGCRFVIAFRNDDGVIAAKQFVTGNADAAVDSLLKEETYTIDCFAINELGTADDGNEFWYRGSSPDDVPDGDDPLNDHWWLYPAAVYYRDVVLPALTINPVTKTILEFA